MKVQKLPYNKILFVILILAVLGVIIYFIVTALVKKKEKYTVQPRMNNTRVLRSSNSFVYPEPPSLNKSQEELQNIASKFSPIYILSKDERYYPVNLGDIMKFCSLRKVIFRSDQPNKAQRLDVIVPAGKLTPQIALGMLQNSDVTMSQEDIVALSAKKFTDPETGETRMIQMYNKNYALVLEPPQNVNEDFNDAILTHQSRIAGYLDNPDFHPVYNKTWYHLGCPGCPQLWKDNGISCQQFSDEVLRRNRQVKWQENPQFCTIQQKQIFRNGQFQYWVTDFIYITYFAFNGSISILPDEGTHFIDIELSAVRFMSEDIIKNGANAKPFRYYTATHAGQSWWNPDKVILRKLELSSPRSGDMGTATHPVFYYSREAHEGYLDPKNTGVRLFGSSNDTVSGGVIWQPNAFVYEVPQDLVSHNIRKHNSINISPVISPSIYFETYVFPKDFDLNYNTPNMWLFYAGKIRPQSGAIATMYPDKVHLNEGQCVSTPDDKCIASSSEPSAPIEVYIPDGCAEPLGDYETFDQTNYWYKPVTVNCFRDYPDFVGCNPHNEDCCIASNNYQSPTEVYAITDVKLIDTSDGMVAPSDYTGVSFNKITLPYIPNEVGFRNKADDVNSYVGGHNIYIYVKYSKVNINSDTKVLTLLLVTERGSKWDPRCGGLQDIGKLSLHTKKSCKNTGLCAQFVPMNQINYQKFISAVALSYTATEEPLTFMTRVNNQPVKVEPTNPYNIQANCCSILSLPPCVVGQKYLYVCAGGNTIYRGTSDPYKFSDNIVFSNGCDPNCKEGPCYADGRCCVPNCSGKNCGDDGCGGNCGMCENGKDCNLNTGVCFDSPTKATYVNFKNDGFGQYLVENLNKTVMKFLFGILSEGMGSGETCCLNDGKEGSSREDVSPCICWYAQAVPNSKDIFIKVSRLKDGKSEVADDIFVDTIFGYIPNVNLNIQGTDNGLIANITSGPIVLNTDIYLKKVNSTIYGRVHLDEGLNITVQGDYQLTTTKTYKDGFVQNTTWWYPPNSTYCDMNNPRNNSLFTPYNPCKDIPSSGDMGFDLLNQGLGWHIKPEALLSGSEYSKTNVVKIKIISNNLSNIQLKLVCGTLLEPLCATTGVAIEGFLKLFMGKIIDKVEGLLNDTLAKVFAYPP